jgi:hypothetical protein
MTVRLFHFSDDPGITIFHPRPVRVSVDRPAGQEWLNGPLVWATDEIYELLYLFPRECPRIVVWPTQYTSIEDRAAWFGDTSSRAIAHIEHDWFDRFRTARIYRYHVPFEQFEDIDDVGMWVSRTPVFPTRIDIVDDLIGELGSRNIELRVMDRLTPLKRVWQTTLHASGIRLRNAHDWGKPGWTHSKPGRLVVIRNPVSD